VPLQKLEVEGVRMDAEIAKFERQNVAGASSHSAAAIDKMAAQHAQQVARPSTGESSGFSIRNNEERARTTKVRVA
jgi:hypothetical protein